MIDKPGLVEAVQRMLDGMVAKDGYHLNLPPMRADVEAVRQALAAYRSRVPVRYDCRECNWIGCSGALAVDEAQEVHDENNADHSQDCRAAVRPLVAGE